MTVKAVLIDIDNTILDFDRCSEEAIKQSAEQFGITRQAVRETVKKVEEELFFYEERLGLLAKFREAQSHTDTALSLCRELSDAQSGDGTVNKLISEINSISDIVSAESR